MVAFLSFLFTRASQNRIVILFCGETLPEPAFLAVFFAAFLGESPCQPACLVSFVFYAFFFAAFFVGKMQISWHPRDGPKKQPPKKSSEAAAELAPARPPPRNPGPKPNTLQGPRPQGPQKPHKRKRIAFMILRRLCTLQDNQAQVYWTQPQLLLYQTLPSSIDRVAQKVGYT